MGREAQVSSQWAEVKEETCAFLTGPLHLLAGLHEPQRCESAEKGRVQGSETSRDRRRRRTEPEAGGSSPLRRTAQLR